MKEQVLDSIARVERLAAAGKLQRLLHHPLKYLFAIGHRKLVYPFQKKEKIVSTRLFYGRTMTIALPASTDIYLTGGKSHPSETRLARYLVGALSAHSVFIDIGAHYGYYTLLASELISEGSLWSFEPSQQAFALLKQNTAALRRTTVFNQAVSRTPGSISFYEFDNLHSEYNSAAIGQFEGEAFLRGSAQRTVEAVSLDSFCAERSLRPTHIKLDVEGFENEVIRGAADLIGGTHKPVIIMEYLAPERKNEAHREAHGLLLRNGYAAYRINADGSLTEVEDIEAHLRAEGLDSDNVVYSV